MLKMRCGNNSNRMVPQYRYHLLRCVCGWVCVCVLYLTARLFTAGHFAAIHAGQKCYQRLYATLQTIFVHVAVPG